MIYLSDIKVQKQKKEQNGALSEEPSDLGYKKEPQWLLLIPGTTPKKPTSRLLQRRGPLNAQGCEQSGGGDEWLANVRFSPP
jgi:hypothetical protein